MVKLFALYFSPSKLVFQKLMKEEMDSNMFEQDDFKIGQLNLRQSMLMKSNRNP